MRTGLPAALALATLALAPGAHAGEDPRGFVKSWINSYGVVEGNPDANVARARAVFERVKEASAPPPTNSPQLVILERYPRPLALSLRDDNIVLSLPGLALAYKGVTPAIGDARLAFVFGHELTHVATQDFWRSFTATAEPRRSLAASSEAEAKADGLGFISAVLAGYDPRAILDDVDHFLLAWAGGHGAAGRTHAAPRERVRRLRANLAVLERRLDTFRFGIRLYQLGRPQDAIALLNTFRKQLPRREVLNALALCHHQLALQALAHCDREEAFRFRLPIRLDPETLKRIRVLRGGSCTTDERFQVHAQEARTLLEKARDQDPSHVPTYVNLSSVLILLAEPGKAMSAADDGLARAPADRALRVNQAIARFDYGQKPNMAALAEEGLSQMRALADEDPADPVATFDLATMLFETDRLAQARESWEAFLKIEPDGVFAALARERLGLPAASPPPPPAPPDPPLPLGRVSAARMRSSALTPRPLELPALRAIVHTGHGLAALELNGGLEVVEEDLAAAIPPAEVAARFGPPRERIETTVGTTLVYDGFALDLVGGAAVRRVYFARLSP